MNPYPPGDVRYVDTLDEAFAGVPIRDARGLGRVPPRFLRRVERADGGRRRFRRRPRSRLSRASSSGTGRVRRATRGSRTRTTTPRPFTNPWRHRTRRTRPSSRVRTSSFATRTRTIRHSSSATSCSAAVRHVPSLRPDPREGRAVLRRRVAALGVFSRGVRGVLGLRDIRPAEHREGRSGVPRGARTRPQGRLRRKRDRRREVGMAAKSRETARAQDATLARTLANNLYLGRTFAWSAELDRKVAGVDGRTDRRGDAQVSASRQDVGCQGGGLPEGCSLSRRDRIRPPDLLRRTR